VVLLVDGRCRAEEAGLLALILRTPELREEPDRRKDDVQVVPPPLCSVARRFSENTLVERE
jgi:hypothetical protein